LKNISQTGLLCAGAEAAGLLQGSGIRATRTYGLALIISQDGRTVVRCDGSSLQTSRVCSTLRGPWRFEKLSAQFS